MGEPMTGGKNQVEEKYILTIDMGTTAFKSAIFDCRGREVSSATEEYQIQTPQPGWAEMDPDRYIDLFQNVIAKAIEKAQVPKTQLITLGISVQGETSVFLDADKKSLRPAILWCDTRALKEAEEIVDAFGCATIQNHTGQVGCDALWPGAKLLWLKKHAPGVFGNIAHILQLNGYFAYLLTGKMAEDDSILGSSIYWNINTRQYWEEMLEYIGITKAQLPEIVRPGSIVGTITKAASKQFDLPENLTVNIGGSDLACGPVGTGAIRPGNFSDSTGSSLCTMAMADHIVLDPTRQMPCYCSVMPDLYMVHAYSTGGMYMKWFRDTFGEMELMKEGVGGLNAFDQLDLMATEVSAGSDGLIALPHLQGSGPPDLNANARACFFGMTIAHGKEHFVRAIMESVVMVLCRIIEATEALDISVDRIISFGGGALSPVWCQMKADATGKDVVTTKNNKSAGCLGAGILAGVACGIWDSVEEACDQIIQEERVYHPDPMHKPIYDELLARYKHLMECLEPVFQ